jgi:serine/threonine protein kinase
MDELQPGDPGTVGSYRLLRRLGAGGMGQVFLGVSPGGRKVAVKLIHPAQAETRQFRERFAREIEAARRVGGFHTAMVLDADPTANPPWMITAYIDGPSLQDIVDRDGPLPTDQVRQLGAALAEGLAAIHACGLVHRDLKPSNVILAADGPRIIDFGIARSVGATTLTTAGAVVGTYAYMSPEQVRGEPAGPASDVFSLAALLAHAATGRLPFGEDSAAAVMFRIVTEPADLTGLADAALYDLLTACLTKSPQARTDVRTVLAELSGVAPPPPGTRPPPLDTRPPRPVASPADFAATETANPATPTHLPAAPPPHVPPPPPAGQPDRRVGRPRRSRRKTTLLATGATAVIAAVLAVVLPIALSPSSHGKQTGNRNKAAGVSDPTLAATTNSVAAITGLRAEDHDATSAAGYDSAIHVDFTVPRSTSTQLNSVQYGLNAATVSGTWTRPGTPGSTTEKSIGSLTNGTSYVVYVRGCDTAGQCGPWAGPSNRVTPYGPPGQPSVSAARASATSITYTWGGGGGNGRPVTAYHVCFDGSCSNMAAGSITKSYGYGQTHTMTAAAIDSAGQQSAPATASETTTANPMTVTLLQGAVGGGGIYPFCQNENCHWVIVVVTHAPPNATLEYTCYNNGVKFDSTVGYPADYSGKANGSGYADFKSQCAWAGWIVPGQTLRVVINGVATGIYVGN